MNKNFVTLKKQDKSFKAYLSGSFSSDYRAIPQQNMNVNTSSEQVTFEIVEKSKISRPHLFSMMFQLFRLEWLSLSLGPLLACYSYLINRGTLVDHNAAVLSGVAVLLLHAAVFMLNDYRDHMTGLDRVNHSGGSQVIQKGWLSAQSVLYAGVASLALGAVVGGFLVLKQPFFLIAVAGFVAISVLGYSFFGRGLKQVGFSELISFFSFGPLMTYGFARATTNSHDLSVILLGVAFGHLAALSQQSRQIENLMSDSQMGFKTLAVKLGFDRAKRLLERHILLSPVLFLLTLLALEQSPWAFLVLIPYGYFCLRLFINVKKSNSLFSSSMDHLRYKLSDLHIILSSLFFVCFWLKI